MLQYIKNNQPRVKNKKYKSSNKIILQSKNSYTGLYNKS